MTALQTFYIAILNIIGKPFINFPRKKKNALITVCFLALVGYFMIYFSPYSHIRFALTFDHLVCSILILIIILCSINESLTRVSWNPIVFYLFIISGAGIIMISFLHPVGSGYRAFGLMMIVGFPCLYFVWNNRGDYNEFFKRLSVATEIIGLVNYAFFIILSLNGSFKMIQGRACGTCADANMFSMVGMIMVCAATYMLLINRGSIMWFVFTCISFAVGVNTVFLGASRLSILVIAGSILSFFIFYIKSQSVLPPPAGIGNKLLRLALLISVTLLMLKCSNLILTVNDTVYGQKVAQLYMTYQEENPGELDAKDSVSADETGDIQQAESESVGVDVIGRFSTDEMTLNSYTANRYTLWKNYAKHLSLLGNDFSKTNWKDLTNNTVKHAHNNFLEIAYRFGVPVACLHTALELVSGIICLIWLFGKKYKKPEYFFSISFMISYAVQSLFDIATLPFERPAPFYFYMALIPVFTFSRKEEA